jgi:hypothetical protein
MTVSLDRLEDLDEAWVRRKLSEEERFAKQSLCDKRMMRIEGGGFDSVLHRGNKEERSEMG